MNKSVRATKIHIARLHPLLLPLRLARLQDILTGLSGQNALNLAEEVEGQFPPNKLIDEFVASMADEA